VYTGDGFTIIGILINVEKGVEDSIEESVTVAVGSLSNGSTFARTLPEHAVSSIEKKITSNILDLLKAIFLHHPFN
jgi:hypothetical protein